MISLERGRQKCRLAFYLLLLIVHCALLYFSVPKAVCAAATLATGTRKGEQLT